MTHKLWFRLLVRLTRGDECELSRRLTSIMAMVFRLSQWGDRIKGLRTAQVETLEVGSAVVALVIGVVISVGCQLSPDKLMFTPAAQSVKGIFPICAWSGVLIPAALMSLVGFVDRNDWLRRLSGAALLGFWLFTATLMFLHGLWVYGAYIHAGFAWFEFWVICRVGQLTAKRSSVMNNLSLRTGATPALVISSGDDNRQPVLVAMLDKTL